MSKRVMVSMEEVPSMQDWKKGVWPMPQPEITPRPVTTTRLFLVDSALSWVVLEEEEEEERRALFNESGRREKEFTLVQITSKEETVGVANLIVD